MGHHLHPDGAGLRLSRRRRRRESRRVLSHRLSITMEAYFHVEAPEEAVAKHGRPEIFTTDQGSRFASADFTSVLIRRADQECNRDQP